MIKFVHRKCFLVRNKYQQYLSFSDLLSNTSNFMEFSMSYLQYPPLSKNSSDAMCLLLAANPRVSKHGSDGNTMIQLAADNCNAKASYQITSLQRAAKHNVGRSSCSCLRSGAATSTSTSGLWLSAGTDPIMLEETGRRRSNIRGQKACNNEYIFCKTQQMHFFRMNLFVF